MKISFAELLSGFTQPMTIKGLADRLGVAEQDVRARLRALTPEEEQQIDQALGL